MTWTTITPDVDGFVVSPVVVDANGWRYPQSRLVYAAPVVTVTGPADVVWLQGQVQSIEQADQLWRVHLVDGTVWHVARPTGRGCACGGGTHPTPIV